MDMTEDCQSIELNDQSLEIAETFFLSWWHNNSYSGCIWQGSIKQKVNYILHVYVALCYVKVTLVQIKIKIWSD